MHVKAKIGIFSAAGLVIIIGAIWLIYRSGQSAGTALTGAGGGVIPQLNVNQSSGSYLEMQPSGAVEGATVKATQVVSLNRDLRPGEQITVRLEATETEFLADDAMKLTNGDGGTCSSRSPYVIDCVFSTTYNKTIVLGYDILMKWKNGIKPDKLVFNGSVSGSASAYLGLEDITVF